MLSTSRVIFTRTRCMKNGETALHLAAQDCSPGTVKILLDYIIHHPTAKLTQLKLTNNKLEKLPPDLELPALESFDLSQNWLQELPNIYAPKLIRLQLYGNQLTHLPELNMPALER